MRRLLVVLAAAFAAALVAGGASAAYNEEVFYYQCYQAGGTVYVPAGSTIWLNTGWGTANPGLMTAFFNAETTTLLINGAPIADADSYWGDPYWGDPIDGVAPFEIEWSYPTGITLAAGETMTAKITLTVSHPIVDPIEAVRHNPPPVRESAGELGPSFTCTITAES